MTKEIFKIGYCLMSGATVGYLVHRLTEKKTTELVTDGEHGMIDACVIGLGQGTLEVVSGLFTAGMLASWMG